MCLGAKIVVTPVGKFADDLPTVNWYASEEVFRTMCVRVQDYPLSPAKCNAATIFRQPLLGSNSRNQEYS